MFSIMMRLLQSHSDNAVQYLINSIKNLKILNYEGENVSKVVSLVRGAYKRLRMITKVPDEFPQWVLQALQTSTVEPFNESFAHLQRNIEVVETLSSGLAVPKYPQVENMLQVAQKLYLDMVSTNKWSGLTTKANQSSFVAQQGNNGSNNKSGPRRLSCWNCGGEGHSLKECTKPVNQAQIDQRKKVFRETNKSQGKGKKGERKNNGKWAPPKSEERNRRVINGKPMYYVHKTKRWEADKRATPSVPGANAAANVPTPGQPPVVSNPNPVSTMDANKTGKDLAVANYTSQVNLAMQGLANIMRDA
jgi:Zinc knuckle